MCVCLSCLCLICTSINENPSQKNVGITKDSICRLFYWFIHFIMQFWLHVYQTTHIYLSTCTNMTSISREKSMKKENFVKRDIRKTDKSFTPDFIYYHFSPDETDLSGGQNWHVFCGVIYKGRLILVWLWTSIADFLLNSLSQFATKILLLAFRLTGPNPLAGWTFHFNVEWKSKYMN
jgi:hypothetical protein